MGSVAIECGHCGKVAMKASSAVNRARRDGMTIYCSRECSGLGRRKGKTAAQIKAEKKAYDAARRIALADQIKAAKAAYHKRTYDPAKAAEYRKQRMPSHIEYCRRPEYREWKKGYDRQYRAQKHYGDYADCFLLVMDIRDECLAQQTDYEIRFAKGGVAKTQQRRREYDRLNRESTEIGVMGNLEFRQGRQNGSLASGLRGLPGPRNSSHHQHPASGRAPVQAASGSGRDQLR